jgi:hypothetical protein
MAPLAIAAGMTSCGLVLGLDDFKDAPRAGAGGGGAGGESDSSSGAGGCAHGDRDCVGDTPRQCADGEWVHQRPCSEKTPVCAKGRCVPCTEGQRGCAGHRPRRCEGGAWVEEAACATPFPGCRDGACVPTSCQGGDAPGTGVSCGADGDEDCCAADVVPGGTFYRSKMRATQLPSATSGWTDTRPIGRFGPRRDVARTGGRRLARRTTRSEERCGWGRLYPGCRHARAHHCPVTRGGSERGAYAGITGAPLRSRTLYHLEAGLSRRLQSEDL